jgi:nucleotide-binding universal stress UspA family protein
MSLVKRAVVGLNLESGTEVVLRAAVVIAKRLASDISLLHVIPSLSSLARDPSEAPKLVETAKQVASQKLAEYRRTVIEEGVTEAEAVILEGIPFDRILGYSDDLDANLILAGFGAQEQETRPMLGITAERLCRSSFRPVFLIKPESKIPPTSILCPVDFSKFSAVALRNALFLARAFESRLTVLTVVPAIPTRYGWLPKEQRGLPDRSQRAFDDFLGEFDFHGVTWGKLVRHGLPDCEILAEVEESRPDLMVMGSVGRTGLWRILLGSVAERVLQAVPCSMLLVKGEDAYRLQLTEQLTDIESHFQHGAELLRRGFAEEARRQFQHCVSVNGMFTPGWEALADCYERLNNAVRADECRAQAKQVRETLSWRQVEADIRSSHPLWQRGV